MLPLIAAAGAALARGAASTLIRGAGAAAARGAVAAGGAIARGAVAAGGAAARGVATAGSQAASGASAMARAAGSAPKRKQEFKGGGGDSGQARGEAVTNTENAIGGAAQGIAGALSSRQGFWG